MSDEPDGSAGPAGAVLVVDDNPVSRSALARQVDEFGHRVETAAGGREALAKLAAAPFDLILLDVIMPGMDGHEVLDRLKADERLREIPVVVVSGLDDFESVVRCIEQGAEDYLAKPFD